MVRYAGIPQIWWTPEFCCCKKKKQQKKKNKKNKKKQKKNKKENKNTKKKNNKSISQVVSICCFYGQSPNSFLNATDLEQKHVGLTRLRTSRQRQTDFKESGKFLDKQTERKLKTVKPYISINTS